MASRKRIEPSIAALGKVQELEAKLEEFDGSLPCVPMPDQEALLSLAQDLPGVWNCASTEIRLKQWIVRILIQEIVADVDEQSSQIVLLLHRVGGRHSELRIKKDPPGRHRRCTRVEAIETIRQMVSQFSDQQTATILNRLGMRTGTDHTWTEGRVKSTRHYHQFAGYDSQTAGAATLTLGEVRQRLGVSTTTVRRMIQTKTISAQQVVPYAPWQIPVEELNFETVQNAIQSIKATGRLLQTPVSEKQLPISDSTLFR